MVRVKARVRVRVRVGVGVRVRVRVRVLGTRRLVEHRAPVLICNILAYPVRG